MCIIDKNKLFKFVSFQDPQTAIPKGTLLSVVITTIVYMLMAVIVGWVVVRDASGDIAEVVTGEFLNCNASLGRNCQYGLHKGFQVQFLLTFLTPVLCLYEIST